MYVAGTWRNLDHLNKPLSSRSDGPWCHKIFRLASSGRVPPLTVAPTGLLIFDPETVHFTPRLFPNEPCPPISDFAGDIYSLDFMVEGALSTAGFLL
jgi:hypothetical protein